MGSELEQSGQFDDRPAYIVKLPEQHEGDRIDAPFAAVDTRRLFDAILAQKIRSKEELSAWAMQDGQPGEAAHESLTVAPGPEGDGPAGLR